MLARPHPGLRPPARGRQDARRSLAEKKEDGGRVRSREGGAIPHSGAAEPQTANGGGRGETADGGRALWCSAHLTRLCRRRVSSRTGRDGRARDSALRAAPGLVEEAPVRIAHSRQGPAARRWQRFGNPFRSWTSSPAPAAWARGSRASSCAAAPSPTGLRNEAQGWREAPTLGKEAADAGNPNGVAAIAASRAQAQRG